MRVAFIVQRYGTEILGGSEYHCRLIAEHLSARHDVEVLTTCAREYTTWENAYPEGADRVRGVTVRRMPQANLVACLGWCAACGTTSFTAVRATPMTPSATSNCSGTA